MADQDIDLRLDDVQPYTPGPPAPDVAPDQSYETHMDMPLDDDELGPRPPVFVDAVVKDDTRLPIIPAGWRGRENITASLKYHAARNAHRAGYHAARAVPLYLPL